MYPQNPPLNPAQPPALPVQPAPPVAPPVQPVNPNLPAANMELNPAYKHTGLATASLILGIVSLPASILNLLSLPIPIVAIVFGIISLKQKKSFAIAGIVLGVIGIILSGAVIAIGVKLAHDKKVNSQSAPGVTGATLSSTCYSFTMPSAFNSSSVRKNSDCQTSLITADSADDIVINSDGLSAPVTDVNRDAYLKNVVADFQNRVGNEMKITSTKFVTLDGARAYQAIGTQNSSNYKYVGIMTVLSPKEYMSVTGIKLKTFTIVYDSATSQDQLDKIAQSWHWK